MSRSIQQLPNNSGTTSVTEVYTSTGFNAGDPVYFQNGDYKNPTNLTAPSTVNFSFANNAAIAPNSPTGVGGIIAPSFTYADMQTGVGGGTARRFASVLTNGNIVQAWSMYNNAPTNNNRVHFRVITPTGTVVVAPTLVSATFVSANYACVSVVALVGGGFAVGWGNTSGGTSNVANYAIYDNAGTVVTAATQDTSLSFGSGGTYCPLEMTALANGGFAIAVKTSGAIISLRSYSSTGVGAYAAITLGFTSAANENSFALTSRSDSSVFICDRYDSTNYYYNIYNSGGTSITGLLSFSTPAGIGSGGYVGSPDASVLPDGTTIVIGYYSANGTYGYPAIRLLPTGNTMGAEIIAIPLANSFYSTNYSGQYLSVQALSSSNFILYFSDGYGNMQYAFYNSSGTCISGSNGTGAIPLQVNGGFCSANNRITLLESSGFVYAYWTAAKNNQKPTQQVFCKISTTSYLVAPLLSVVGAPYTVTGQPTGASIPSTINPNSLSYYSTSSSSTVATNTPATLIGPTVASSSTVEAVANCVLTNGNFVLVWKNASGYAVFANVYSPSGGLISSISVGTGASGQYGLRVCALSDGGFIVAYHTSSTVLTLARYSSGYSFSSSTTITINTYSVVYNFDIAGLPDGKCVVFYSFDGSSARVQVFSSSFTILQTVVVSGTPQGLAIANNSWGGFAIAYFRQGSSGNAISYVPTGTNTWASVAASGLSSCDAYPKNPQLCATESGLYIFTQSTSGYPSYGMWSDPGVASVSYTTAMSAWPFGSANAPTTYPCMGIGLTGDGSVVIATSYNSTSLGIGSVPAQMTFSSGQTVEYNIAGSNSIPMFSKNGYTTAVAYDISAQPRVSSGAGSNAIISFIGANQYPNFIIINGACNSNVYSITAGVTPSALTPIAPVATSGVISGAFAGVAITSATAGSTGQLATNGQALLGASYTSTATGAFDSTGGAVSGLKGTFNGRSVNLQGNS